MAQPYGATGTRVYISTAVTSAPADSAAYGALSWTEIGDVESLGDFGDEAQILTANSLGRSRVVKVKGPYDAGSLTITVLDKPDDTGQAAAKVAAGTSYDYPIKVILPNPVTVGGTGEIAYLIGKVSSKSLNVGDATNIVKRRFTVAINSEITEVPAT